MTALQQHFKDRGYIRIRQLFSSQEANFYRKAIQDLSGIGDADYGSKVFECPDGVSKNRAFWPIIDHPKLLRVVRELLGPTARYTQHSDLHAHRGGLGWHRDSACRTFGVGPDWDESASPYQVTRVAIYLQRFSESRSLLGVIPGSHRFEQMLTDDQWTFWKTFLEREYRIERWLSRLTLGKRPLAPRPNRRTTLWTDSHFDLERDRPTTPVWIPTEPGDCILFNQRLLHSASPIIGPKYAVYLSYSPENEHARNHLAYYRHVRKDLNYGPLDPELIHRLQSSQLFMEAPGPLECDGAFVPSSQ